MEDISTIANVLESADLNILPEEVSFDLEND